MKHKTRLLVCVFCTVSIGFLAYQAGANTQKLDPHYQNYNDLNSSNKNDQISQQMRNGLLNRLATRVQNHEARISALAANAKEPTLTSAQMNFNKHQSNESNHNRLTRDMRNDLLNMLTFAITNHEARLVQAELNCKPTTTKQYQCEGSYTVPKTQTLWKSVSTNEIRCYQRTFDIHGRQKQRRTETSFGACKVSKNWDTFSILWDLRNGFDHEENNFWNGERSEYRLGLLQWTEVVNLPTACILENYSGSPSKWEKITMKSCRYSCNIWGVTDRSYCQQETIQEPKQCSALAENSCKQQTGCSRVEKK